MGAHHRILLEQDDLRARNNLARAFVRFDHSGQAFEQGRLAGAIAADQGKPIPRPDENVEIPEQPAFALDQAEVFVGKDRRCHRGVLLSNTAPLVHGSAAVINCALGDALLTPARHQFVVAGCGTGGKMNFMSGIGRSSRTAGLAALAASLISMPVYTAKAEPNIPDYDWEENLQYYSCVYYDKTTTHYAVLPIPKGQYGTVYDQFAAYIKNNYSYNQDHQYRCELQSTQQAAEQYAVKYSRDYGETKMDGFVPDWSETNPDFHRWYMARRKEGALPDRRVGMMCVASFRHTARGYYGQAGTEFAYVSWTRVANLRELPSYEQSLLKKYEKDVADQNADPSGQLLDDAVLTGVSCEQVELSGNQGWAKTWGATNTSVDDAIQAKVRNFGIDWYFDDRVEFSKFGLSRKSDGRKSVKTDAEASADKKAGSGKDAGADKKSAAKDEPSAVELAAARHAEVEQRNREKQDKYEADMKAWQDQIDAQKAEEERKKAKFAADKQAAAEKLAVFEAEQAAHRSEMEKHAQRLLEHQDAQRLHSLCTVGDRAACDRLAGGKLAEAKLPKTDAGEASTDDDARQCVTEPVLSPNEAYKGSLKAVVTNGCAKPVDVLICLMRTGGWNCGMTVGLKPQDNWTWWTMNPQDGVFWDARTTGSKRNLDRPAGA